MTSRQLVDAGDWALIMEGLNLSYSTGHAQPVVSQEMGDDTLLTGLSYTVRCVWRIPPLSPEHSGLRVAMRCSSPSGTGVQRWTSLYGGGSLTFDAGHVAGVPTSKWYDSPSLLPIAADPSGEYEEITLETKDQVSLENIYATYERLDILSAWPAADGELSDFFDADFYPLDSSDISQDECLSSGLVIDAIKPMVGHLKGRRRVYCSISAILGFFGSRLGHYPHRAVIPVTVEQELVVWVRYENVSGNPGRISILVGDGGPDELDNREEWPIAGGGIYSIDVPGIQAPTWVRFFAPVSARDDVGTPGLYPGFTHIAINDGAQSPNGSGAIVTSFVVWGQ